MPINYEETIKNLVPAVSTGSERGAAQSLSVGWTMSKLAKLQAARAAKRAEAAFSSGPASRAGGAALRGSSRFLNYNGSPLLADDSSSALQRRAAELRGEVPAGKDQEVASALSIPRSQLLEAGDDEPYKSTGAPLKRT